MRPDLVEMVNPDGIVVRVDPAKADVLRGHGFHVQVQLDEPKSKTTQARAKRS